MFVIELGWMRDGRKGDLLSFSESASAVNFGAYLQAEAFCHAPT